MYIDHACYHAAIFIQGSVVYYVQSIANCIGMGGSIRQLLAAKNLQVSINCIEAQCQPEPERSWKSLSMNPLNFRSK